MIPKTSYIRREIELPELAGFLSLSFGALGFRGLSFAAFAAFALVRGLFFIFNFLLLFGTYGTSIPSIGQHLLYTTLYHFVGLYLTLSRGPLSKQ